MDHLFKYLNKHVLFWIAVFSFYIAVDRVHFSTTERLFTIKFIYLLFQMVTAYTIIYFIIPQYKQFKSILILVLMLFVLFAFLNVIYVGWQYLFYNPNSCYGRFKAAYGHLPLYLQIFNWRQDFLIISWLFIQPTFFLIPFLWYEKNLNISIANEQKKIAELSALKNQLNPHFLFNTLNNLYTLALEKSDNTPKVIERLSEILDYILYRCNDKYVPLNKEVELIENYLALEKLRYGKRVDISLNTRINSNDKIAPLILLTFIENAFKHGVKQELYQANINIELTSDGELITFRITNSKSKSKAESRNEKLGLKNVKHQLALLYPGTHKLLIEDEDAQYTVTLELKSK